MTKYIKAGTTEFEQFDGAWLDVDDVERVEVPNGK